MEVNDKQSRVMASGQKTALILVDPYNDFLHPDGKLVSTVQASLAHNDAIKHMLEAVATARRHGIPVFYGLHQQWQPSSFHDWRHMTASNLRQSQVHFFAEGSFGAQIFDGLEPVPENNDVVVSKHWNSKSVIAPQRT